MQFFGDFQELSFRMTSFALVLIKTFLTIPNIPPKRQRNTVDTYTYRQSHLKRKITGIYFSKHNKDE